MKPAPFGVEARWGAFFMLGYAMALSVAVRSPTWRFLPIGELLVSFALVGVLVVSLTSALAFATRRIPAQAVTLACLTSFAVVLVYHFLWWLAIGWGLVNRSPTLGRLLSLRARLGVAALVVILVLTPMGRALRHAFNSRASAAGRQRSRVRWALALVLLAGTAVTFASRALAGRAAPKAHPTPDGARNIVIVLLDGLSANHANLPGLSYERETTPNLGRLAEHGRVFSRAYTNSVSTRGTIKSVFTGVPFIRSHSPLSEPVPPTQARRTLLTEAQEAGYTIGYISSYENVIPEALGFDPEGWLVESAVWCGWPDLGVNLNWFCVGVGGILHWHEYPTISSAFAKASAVLSRLRRAQPFILFVHVLAPHHPYRPIQSDRRYSNASGETWDLYDDYVRSADRMTAQFVQGAWRSAPRTLVIVFGDHGLRGLGDVMRAEDWTETGQAVHVPVLVLGEGVSAGVDSSLLGLSELWSRILDASVPGFPSAPLVRQLRDSALVTEMDGRPMRVAAILRGSMCVLQGGPEEARCFGWAPGRRGDDGHRRSPTTGELQSLLEIREALAAPSVWQAPH